MEKVEYKGYSIEIEHDECAENPRTEWDSHLGTMVCFHKRYELGDEDHGYDKDDYDSWEELEKAIMKNEDIAVILPIYMYDHSGVTINTTGFNCQWDSGQIGFIFVSKRDARKQMEWTNFTKKRLVELNKYLLGEIRVYDNYLTGGVYRYTLKSLDGEDLEGDEMDSCSGFYGYDHKESGLMACAEDFIDCIVSAKEKEEREAGIQQELQL